MSDEEYCKVFFDHCVAYQMLRRVTCHLGGGGSRDKLLMHESNTCLWLRMTVSIKMYHQNMPIFNVRVVMKKSRLTVD